MPEDYNAVYNEFRNLFEKEFIQDKMREARHQLKQVRILISGKTGVGKTTLINKMFGRHMGDVSSCEPVTQGVMWHEPDGSPIALCDTRGLELKDYKKTLDAVEAELKNRAKLAETEKRIHISWICIAEPSTRVEDGEKAQGSPHFILPHLRISLDIYSHGKT